MAKRGENVQVPVLAIEYFEGGNTLWVQAAGGTVIRIKCSGKIMSKVCNTSPVSHADLLVDGDITMCLGKDV